MPFDFKPLAAWTSLFAVALFLVLSAPSCSDKSSSTAHAKEIASKTAPSMIPSTGGIGVSPELLAQAERARKDLEAADGIADRAIRDDEIERWLVVKNAVLKEVGPPSQEMTQVRAWNAAKTKHCQEQALAESAYLIIEGRMMAAKLASKLAHQTGSVPEDLRADLAVYQQHEEAIQSFEDALRKAAAERG